MITDVALLLWHIDARVLWITFFFFRVMVSLIVLATYTLSSLFCLFLLLVIHRDASLIVSGLTLSLFVMYLLYLSFLYYFFYLSLLLSYLLYLLYFLLLFIIFNSFILSIIITKAAFLASLYPGLPKQLYKIMRDLGNRLVMILFYRIVFFRSFDKKNSVGDKIRKIKK